MPVGAAILGGAIVGGVLQSRSAGKAAKAQSQSAAEANALQKYMFDQQRKDTAPYRKAGASALTQIQALLKNPSRVTREPGYQFGIDQGVNALENSASARGMTYSGAQAKALQQFGNDYGTTKIDQTYNRLSNIAGLGQVGVNPVSGMNYANNVGSNMLGVGNAQAAAQIAKGSAYGNALNAGLAYGDRNGWFRSGGGGFTGNNDFSGGNPMDNFLRFGSSGD
jgi:hypothetical protein